MINVPAPRNAVKAFIINSQNQILLLRRQPNNVQRPDQWDIPGGRLDLGEDPYDGLRREVRQETGLEITIPLRMSLYIDHFTRTDGQIITMMFFLCKWHSGQVTLSPEHQQYGWLSVYSPLESFPEWLRPVIVNYKRLHSVIC